MPTHCTCFPTSRRCLRTVSPAEPRQPRLSKLGVSVGFIPDATGGDKPEEMRVPAPVTALLSGDCAGTDDAIGFHCSHIYDPASFLPSCRRPFSTWRKSCRGGRNWWHDPPPTSSHVTYLPKLSTLFHTSETIFVVFPSRKLQSHTFLFSHQRLNNIHFRDTFNYQLSGDRNQNPNKDSNPDNFYQQVDL